MRGSDWIRYAKRLAIYARDGFRCVACGRTDLLTLDHVIPSLPSEQRNNSENNLITLCAYCNSEKGARTIKAWRPELASKVKSLLGQPIDIYLGKKLAKVTRPR